MLDEVVGIDIYFWRQTRVSLCCVCACVHVYTRAHARVRVYVTGNEGVRRRHMPDERRVYG